MKTKKINLKKIFIFWFAAMLVLVIFYFPEDRGIVISEPDFHVPESQELYFKNIRQSHYNKRSDNESGFDIYTIRSAETDSTQKTFTFNIINNWRADEAFIRLIPMPALFSSDPDELTVVTLPANEETPNDTITLGGRSSYDHYLFAAHLYMKIINDYQFKIMDESGEIIPILDNGKHRNSVKKTLKDYFKLTGKIR